MIKIKDRFQPVENRPDTILLRYIQKDADNLLDWVNLQIKENKVDIAVKFQFLKELSELNKVYRVDILEVKADSKTPAITVNSYNKRSIKDILSEKFGFKFTWSYESNEGEHATAVEYSTDKFWIAMKYATAILCAKYPYDANLFQLQLTCIKVLFEYFDLSTIKFDEIHTVMDNFFESDFSVIQNIMTDELNYLEKRREPKSLIPTKEDFELWISNGFGQTEIKRMVAKQLNCSEKTVQRMLAKYNLTKKR